MSVKLFLVVAIVAIFVTVNSAQSSPQQSSSHNVKESNGNTRKMRLLTMNPGVVRFYRMMGGSGGPRQQEDEAVPDDDSYFQKRQQYDDYGHMRFGKRNPDFDDYGHMRFGK